MKLFLRFLIAAILVAGICSAATISGSLPLSGLNVSLLNGTNLFDTTQIHAADTIAAGNGTGDLLGITTGILFGATTLDLNNLASFSFMHATWGSFQAGSGLVVRKSVDFMDVYLLGIFNPGTAMAGFDPSPTSLRVSLNMSGGSVSQAITLNSPAVPPEVPEPATLALSGVALVGLGFIRYRRSAV